jgi:hypothetical protein
VQRRSPQNFTLDEHFLGNVEVFLERCQAGQRATFFFPGSCGEWNKAKDVLSPATVC